MSQKTLHPGLSSVQPSGLATPEACEYISPGYAFFAYPGKTFNARTAPRRRCEECTARQGGFVPLGNASEFKGLVQERGQSAEFAV